MFLMRYIKEDRLLKMVCFCFLLSACNTFEKKGGLSGFSENGFEDFKIGDNSQLLSEDISSWRVFPRSTNYQDRIHIVNEDYLQVSIFD